MCSITLPEDEVVHMASPHHVLRKWAVLFLPILPEGVFPCVTLTGILLFVFVDTVAK